MSSTLFLSWCQSAASKARNNSHLKHHLEERSCLYLAVRNDIRVKQLHRMNASLNVWNILASSLTLKVE